MRQPQAGRAAARSSASSARPASARRRSGRSIARALGRKFERISVGGVRDEAEIRGHRRTYIGAMPGAIIRALRDAELATTRCSCSTRSTRSAPTSAATRRSAMLEVLDPEQNATFRDHYLDVPFDLSRVMFITTANTLDTVPGPLRDRMEVIQLAGYTEEEKLQIAKRYLVPRQIERNGLQAVADRFTDAALRRDHRGLHARGRRAQPRARDRHGRAARSRAQVAEGTLKRKVSVTGPRVRELLGRPRFHPRSRRRTARAGRGDRAWRGRRSAATSCSSRRPRCPARAAHAHRPARRRDAGVGAGGAVLRARPRRELAPDLPEDWFATHDLHLHVPGGRDPQGRPERRHHDGDRAGLAAHGRPVRDDVAMTGEITLTGQVLPIGGLKEKVLAAQRAGISA